jgi:prepilin-type N-terminal cleavage/methylation domain-containing protein
VKHKQRGVTLVEVLVVVAILAVLAAVAIPAAVRRARVGRTAEVYESLERIARSAEAYFHTEHFGPWGLAARGFPSTVAFTPIFHCCNQPGDLCAGGSSQWTGTTWEALHFAHVGAHYYQYGFATVGTDAAAIFTVYATGDLDCDGTTATFSRRGWVTDAFEVEHGPIEIPTERQYE